MKTLYISVLLACFAFTAKAAPPSFPSMSLLIAGTTPLPYQGTFNYTTPIPQGTVQTFVFTIANSGTADLNIIPVNSFLVTLTGSAASEVSSIQSTIVSPVAALGGFTSFSVTSSATTPPGPYSLTLSIANDDPAKNPFTGTVTYTIAAATPTINAKEALLSMYPNPSADGQFSVKGDFTVEKVIVYGASGTTEELTGNTLFYTRQRGILVVHVYTNIGIVVDKIIVQ